MRRKRAVSLLLALVLCLALLPGAALAEEQDAGVSYTITFDPNGGAFPGGSKVFTTRTKWLGAGNNITEQPPIPERSGYVFDSWDVNGSPVGYGPIGNVNFTADTIVRANWAPNANFVVAFDPDGGACDVAALQLEGGKIKAAALPVPTKAGYIFKGWFRSSSSSPITLNEMFTGPDTVKAQWERASKTSPAVTASPAGIAAGAAKVQIALSCATSGVSLDWRPLERAVTSSNKTADLAPIVRQYLSGNFSEVGLTLTGLYYTGGADVNYNAYPFEYYPDSVCPASQLILTLEGAAKPGTLSITLAPDLFLELVYKGETTVLKETRAQIFNSANVSVPVDAGGSFTVKFDLNYYDKAKEKASERPKDQTVFKGGAVALPDGSKLTAPADTHEFYAWCVATINEKGETVLFPWKESAPVTHDMTLYAGWVRKGSVVIDGQPLEYAPGATAQATTPSAPAAAPKFTDVPASSPFAPAISWAVEKGITNGATPTTFAPGATCTRAQIVTFLWRAAGSPEPQTLEAEYADVTNTAAYFYKAVQWAAEMGMEESGAFRPSDPCTRGQAVYFIWKANGSAGAGSAPAFTDLPRNSLYYDAVLWAVGRGVTNGTGDGTTFSPDAACTRGQIVTFLYRAYEGS